MRFLLATLAGVTLLLAGCGSASQTAPTVEVTPPPGAPVAPAGWRPSAADRELLVWSEDVIAGQCMRGLDYEYWTSPPAREAAGWPLPYVVDDPAWARLHGYGGLGAKTTKNPNRAYVDGLSPARQAQYTEALFGPASGGRITARTPAGQELEVSGTGCLAKARTQLYGDLRVWFAADTVVSNLQSLIGAKVTGDQRYVRGQANWVACVRKAGHRVSTPAQLQAAVPDAQHERAYAEVEATCAVRSGFGTVARALDAEFRTAVEKQYAGPVRTLRGLQHRALETARDLSGRSAGGN